MTENKNLNQEPEMIREGKFAGLKNAQGEVILPPAYQDIKLMSLTAVKNGDRVVVQQDDKWGVMIADGKGTWLWKPEFDDIGYPNDITYARSGDKWGVLDLTKKDYLIPLECDHLDNSSGFMFTNGICFYSRNGKHGVISDDGRFTEAIFDDIDFDPMEYVKVEFQGKWGYIDENNQFTEEEEEAAYYPSLD